MMCERTSSPESDNSFQSIAHCKHHSLGLPRKQGFSVCKLDLLGHCCSSLYQSSTKYHVTDIHAHTHARTSARTHAGTHAHTKHTPSSGGS
eukprot:scaffold62397_cov16-Tisochrysis_lutea.AAC.2